MKSPKKVAIVCDMLNQLRSGMKMYVTFDDVTIGDKKYPYDILSDIKPYLMLDIVNTTLQQACWVIRKKYVGYNTKTIR